MNKKFLEIVARQTELAMKVAAGKASDEEIAELKKLTTAVKAATEPTEPAKTTLKTMTLAEYKEWHDGAVKVVEEKGDSELLAIVKRNLAAVKSQDVTDSEGVVAVEVPLEKSEEDKIAALEARIAELEAKGADTDTDTDTDADADADADSDADADTDADDTNKGDKPTAQALALEAIDTLLVKYEKIKKLIESGSLTRDEIDEIWEGDWRLKDVIVQGAEILKKTIELKEAIETCTIELEKLAKEEDDTDGDTDDDGEGDGEEGAGEPEGTSKGDEPSPWLSGGDMSPRASADEQLAAINKNKNKHGY